MNKKLTTLFLPALSFTAYNQQIIPYRYYQYQKLNRSLYNINTRFHTSMKPVIGDNSTLTAKLDSLLAISTGTTAKNCVMRKLYNQHLVHGLAITLPEISTKITSSQGW